jgi:hypothetical protein
MADPPLQYATPLPNSADTEHLRLLVIFHYICAALVALFGSFFLIHVVLGILIVSGAIPMHDNSVNGTAAPQWIGYIFILIGLIPVCIGWGIAILLFLSARHMSARRRRLFSIVIACISCGFMPFGTILGVFTIIVLSRPSVKMMYGE